MTTPTKAYRTWRQRLAAPTIGHGSVIQLCRNIYPGSIGCRRLGKNSALTEAECEELISAFRARVKLDGGPRATPQKEELGRNWLNEYARRLGLPRDPAHPYLEITEFHLVGIHVYDMWDDNVDAAPIWRAFWADGAHLDYAPTAWQSSFKAKLPKLWWSGFGAVAA